MTKHRFAPAARHSVREARRARADQAIADLIPIIAELRAAGVTSVRGIAAALNERGIPNRGRLRSLVSHASGAAAGAVALAATYRAAAFFRLLPIAQGCSNAPVGATSTLKSASARTTTVKPRSRADRRAGRSVRLSNGHGERTRAGHAKRACGPLPDPESLEVSHKALADYGTEPLRGQRFSLPSAQDCYHCANRCLDMWNDSVDHATRSWLLRMADAWLQLASEFEK
jgi:hypothetical protein